VPTRTDHPCGDQARAGGALLAAAPPSSSRRALARRALLAGLAVTGLGLAAAGPAAASPTASASTTPSIRWETCQAEELTGARCGTLSVPIDWTRPAGAKTRLSLVVKPAENPDRRVGPLLVNNGGGGSAIEQLRLGLQTGAIAGTLTERFDLIALDPRGVGQSSPVRCGRPQRSEAVTYFPDDKRAFKALVADNRVLAAACRRETGPLLEHLELETHARDVEAVRRALGARRLTFYGIHWSTLLGRTYARLFGDRLQGIVLDTALDDSVPPVERLAAETTAVETALSRFAAWCADATECALRGQDVLQRFDALVVRADAAPIPAGELPALEGEDVRRAAQEHLVIRLYWPGFAAALQQALAGDATALATIPDATYDPLQEHAVNCATTPPAARTFRELAQLERMTRQLAPHTAGASRAWDTAAGCIGWPGRPSSPDSGRPARHAPPALLLQSTHNSLAPYSHGFGLARQLPGSEVLSREGDDYSVIIFSRCAATAFDEYATAGRLPAPGTLCLD
jgi:pimeloyl-ACP methyl ester carboxylesterase